MPSPAREDVPDTAVGARSGGGAGGQALCTRPHWDLIDTYTTAARPAFAGPTGGCGADQAHEMSSDQVAQHWSLFWMRLSPCCIDHAHSPRRFRLLPVVALALVFLPVTAGVASGQSFESLGTCFLGMGGAFVAVADDASAPYWNPAGIATGALVAVGISTGVSSAARRSPIGLLAPAERAAGRSSAWRYRRSAFPTTR